MEPHAEDCRQGQMCIRDKPWHLCVAKHCTGALIAKSLGVRWFRFCSLFTVRKGGNTFRAILAQRAKSTANPARCFRVKFSQTQTQILLRLQDKQCMSEEPPI